MAGTTGLEPATSDVTGRRSNQLNYVPALCRNFIHPNMHRVHKETERCRAIARRRIYNSRCVRIVIRC